MQSSNAMSVAASIQMTLFLRVHQNGYTVRESEDEEPVQTTLLFHFFFLTANFPGSFSSAEEEKSLACKAVDKLLTGIWSFLLQAVVLQLDIWFSGQTHYLLQAAKRLLTYITRGRGERCSEPVLNHIYSEHPGLEPGNATLHFT